MFVVRYKMNTMEKMPMILGSLTILLALFTVAEGNGCEDQQIVEIGRRSILNCSFSEGFVGVLWYNSTNFEDDPPILVFQHSEKSGKGYASGEFDILPSGSLIINDVSIMHETVFLVSQIINFKDPVKWHSVKVITYVKPSATFAVIRECNGKQHCFLGSSNISSLLNCYVNNARPKIKLFWIDPFNEEDNNVTKEHSTNDNSLTFSSAATTEYLPSEKNFLSLLACSATDPLMLLREDISLVLIQNEAKFVGNMETLKLYFEVGTVANLSCPSGSGVNAVLWQMSRSLEDDRQALAYRMSVPHVDVIISLPDAGVELQNDGDLMIRGIQPQHEGFFFCIVRSKSEESIRSYEVITQASQENSVVDDSPTNNSAIIWVIIASTVVLIIIAIIILTRASFKYRANRKTSTGSQNEEMAPLKEDKQVNDENMAVSWKPNEHGFYLDSSKSKWVSNSKEATTLETKDENSLRRFCSSIVRLGSTDSKELQMATILLLEIASSHYIPVSDLCLFWSFNGFDGIDIRLESGLCLSILASVEKISINAGEKQELTEEEVIGLINYGIQSPRFKQLWLYNCKLPSSIKPDIIPEESRSRNIIVISSSESRYLDIKSGQWRKPEDTQTITEMCSGDLVIHRDTSESVQMSVIELLVEASNLDIPIHKVTLVLTFSKIDEDGNMMLSSDLYLPILTSIERMGIQIEEGREVNKHEVNGILNYLQHSQRFKELILTDCLLPSSIPAGPSLSTLKSRGVNVFWFPDSAKDDEYYRLDLESGRWEKFGSW